MFDGIIGGVKVVCERREFGSNGVNLLDEWRNAEFLSKSTNRKLGGTHTGSKLSIGKPELFGLPELGSADRRDVIGA